ncbi:MAG: hypothetical protein A2Z29_06290 [Chloroflexi bacterium RBG_16_56_11]|nr:MAG: hypothetical protein A2Z29_06290 [Chloroflexi bacterium RBG_16_56_11]
MARKKYSEYVIKALTVKGDFPPLANRMVYDGLTNGGSGNVGIRYSFFYGPPFQFEVPHKHDYDQFLCFLGTPEDVSDFDAEVEIWLGEEKVKHTITQATIVHVPAGLLHCPMNYKRISKPIMLINITLGGEYIKKDAKGALMPLRPGAL